MIPRPIIWCITYFCCLLLNKGSHDHTSLMMLIVNITSTCLKEKLELFSVLLELLCVNKDVRKPKTAVLCVQCCVSSVVCLYWFWSAVHRLHFYKLISSWDESDNLGILIFSCCEWCKSNWNNLDGGTSFSVILHPEGCVHFEWTIHVYIILSFCFFTLQRALSVSSYLIDFMLFF